MHQLCFALLSYFTDLIAENIIMLHDSDYADMTYPQFKGQQQDLLLSCDLRLRLDSTRHGTDA